MKHYKLLTHITLIATLCAVLIFLLSPFASPAVRANPIEEAETKLPKSISQSLKNSIISQIQYDFSSTGYVKNSLSLRKVATIGMILSTGTSILLILSLKKR